MNAIERWVLLIADSDLTWIGFHWLRPTKDRRLGPGYILFSSILLGLPGVAMGGGLIYLFIGRVEPLVWLLLFSGATVFELVLHVPFAYFWNKRAEALKSSAIIST